MKTQLKLYSVLILALVFANANAQDWSLIGNAGTNPAINFIGTSDNHSFVIRSNNTNRIFVDSTGKVGIGTSAPTYQLQFSGGKFNLSATSTTNSSIIKTRSKLEIQNGVTSITFAAFDAVNQRVGIGTTTPTTPLDVNGIITATGGNSTNWNTAFGWGNHAAAGYLTSYTETDPQVGTITTSYVPRWNGSALVTGSIFDNATSVGIGTSTVADSKFSVEQTGTLLATTKFLNTSKGPNISWIHFNPTGDWYIRSAANAGVVILQDQAGGNVGIGTTPGVKLDVNSGATSNAARFAATTSMYIALNEGSSYRGYLGSYAGIAEDVDFGTGSGNATGSLHLTIQAAPKLTIKPSGDVCIGTTTPATGYKLSVYGKIICEEMKVQLQPSWPDYVFNDDYKLKSLEEVERYISKNGHLPGMPSAAEVKENGGIHVGEMQAKLLEKIEEQSLYIFLLNDEIKKLKEDNVKLFQLISSGK